MTSLFVSPHRRTKASIATRILIHLVLALFLLNLTFLTNNYVAKLKSSVGCKIMAALMHYFMLATFTWFAVQAFHICQQLYMGGKTVIRHYMIKVCITSWGESASLFFAFLYQSTEATFASHWFIFCLHFQYYRASLGSSCSALGNMVNKPSLPVTPQKAFPCESVDNRIAH